MLMEISVDELMVFFVDTLQKCGLYLLEMNDEDIEYNIFEEFDVSATSFLHDNTLSKLKEADLINGNMSRKASELRSRFIELQDSDKWNVESVRHDKKWREILELSDEIKSLLCQ
ncbi:MAG: hypothetical protein LBH09_08045 [Peptococcaceae bacterium]|jgi:predicted transcriptional regulator|nr:hypothetical protein [Peptococcaceae bacterium]